MKIRTMNRALVTALLAMLLVPLAATAEDLADTNGFTAPSPTATTAGEEDSVTLRDPESGMTFLRAGQNYYVTGRYACVSVQDGSSRGTCDVTTWANSCSEARSAHERDIRSRGDVCQHCVKGQTDRTRRRSGEPRKWIHGGPCR